MKLALLALFVSFFVLLISGPVLIPLLRRLKIGQTIRSDGPVIHLSKTGTPTMGGLLFLPAFFLVIFVFSDYSPALWLSVCSFLGFGVIGCWDDMLKVVLKRSLGLTARQKLVGQFLLILIFLYLAVNTLGRGTDLIMPITNYHLDLGFWYYPLWAVIFVGMINAVNLTDGLDGLASGVSFLAFIAYLLIAAVAINNPPVEGIDYNDLALFAGVMAGVCLGFLFFNHYPAKVFMGDTGALAIGGALVALAVFTKTEIVFLFIGGVYLIEALSVMLQVFSFRVLGRRIFKMSPLHHHFEMLGWKETKVVALFWAVALFCALLGLIMVSL